MAENKTGSTISPGLIVCKLTGEEFQQRKAELQKLVFTNVVKYEEKEDGYKFYFKDEEDMLTKVADYMVTEHECCPFFDFELTVKAHNGGIAWTVTGPPEAKEMIMSLLKKD